MAQNETGSLISLPEIAVLIYRQRKRLLAAVLTPLVLALLLLIFMPRTYTAQTDIFVKTGREYLPQSDEGAMSAPASTKQEDINSEIELLNSPTMIISAIDAIGMDNLFPGLKDHPPMFGSVTDAAEKAFSSNLSVEPVKLSNVIRLTYQAGSPEQAAKILDQFVLAYQARHAQVYSNGSAGSYEDSIKSALADLDALEKRRTEIKLENHIYDIAQQRAALITQRVEAEAKLQDTISNRATLQKRVAYLLEEKPKVPANLPPAQEMLHATQSLTDMQEAEAEMSTRYGPANPDLIRVREQLQALRERMGGLKGELSRNSLTPSPLAQQIDHELVMDQAELAPLDDEIVREKTLISASDDELHRLEQADLELRTIGTRVESLNENLKNLQQRFEQARTEEDMDRSKLVSVTQLGKSVAPDKASNPKTVFYLGGGLVVGLMIAAGMIIASILRNNKILVEESVERIFGLPVLASLPVLPRQPQLTFLPKPGL